MQDLKTTRAALAAVLMFVVARIAQHFGVALPHDVMEGIVVLFLAYGLHKAADAQSNPNQPITGASKQ